MKTIVIIPSRYQSVRLPRKPLVMIKGISLVERVYRQCEQAEGIDEIYVATDHPEIRDLVEGFGGRVIMTPESCPSGTDRIAVAAEMIGASDAIVINVQGDEPLIDPSVISALAEVMQQNSGLGVATPITRMHQAEDLTNPNVVKVVTTEDDDALYFSRQAIPFVRDLGAKKIFDWVSQFPYFKHIGVYAYRSEVLKQFTARGESSLERAERLEQLRLLEAGIRIRCVEVNYESVAVDTEEDVRKVELLLEQKAEDN